MLIFLHIAHFLQLRIKWTDLHILTSTENIIEVLNYFLLFTEMEGGILVEFEHTGRPKLDHPRVFKT